jgi:TonB family protein
MKPLITTLFLFITVTACFAQRQNVYFLKNNGTYVQQRDSADYICVVSEPDSGAVLYNVFEFYPNGKTKLTGRSSTIDPQTYEGICVRYFRNGKRQSVTNYKKGKIIGTVYEFYPNGKPYYIRKYADTFKTDYNGSYLITAEYDSLGTALITDSNGYYKGYDDEFKNVVEEGNIKNGRNDGQWKGMDEGLHIRFIETYDKGKFMGGISIGDHNDTVKYKAREVEPQYKGGPKAFGNFLANNIQYPDHERANNTQGTVKLSFVVEKDGKVSDVKVVKNVSYNIDKEALRVINLSRNWIPGFQYGRPVQVIFTQSINFSLRD